MRSSLFCSLLAVATAGTGSAGAREAVALLGTYTDSGSRGIYAVRVDGERGVLSEPTLVAELADPEFLALHPNGRFVYALTHNTTEAGKKVGAVAAFEVEPLTGKLTFLNTAATDCGTFCHLAVDATGRMLVAASYGGGHVASFTLQADGRVGDVRGVITHEGTRGPRRDRQEAPHPHSVTLSPDNRFAYVADLGLDRVFVYRIDLDTATLVPATPAYFTTAAGAGPRHAAFSTDGGALHVLNELNNTLATWRYDEANGALELLETSSTLPEGFEGQNTTSEVRVHPKGRFVYAANRGHDSVAVFARKSDTPLLERVEIVPCGGVSPRNFALTPDGRWLLCAHQRSASLALFRVDADSGRLELQPALAKVPRVVCVLFLPQD